MFLELILYKGNMSLCFCNTGCDSEECSHNGLSSYPWTRLIGPMALSLKACIQTLDQPKVWANGTISDDTGSSARNKTFNPLVVSCRPDRIRLWFWNLSDRRGLEWRMVTRLELGETSRIRIMIIVLDCMY